MSLALGKQKSTFINSFARFILKISGWRTHVIPPHTTRYVLIGAPHTSNWDFILALMLMTVERIPVRIMGKDSLFRWPLGVFMRAIGAIPVNRRERTSLVNQIVAKFNEHNDFIIGISPEGTRSRTSYWRTGFYYIAQQARVPIVMAYLDYKNKIVGLGPSIKPSGDIKADFSKIKEFYQGISGKYPHKQGKIEIPEN